MKNKIKLQFLFAICALFASNVALAEIKNSQDILGGLLTRAGVKGQKPLSSGELKALCEAGYTNAYFLYRGAEPRTVSCSKGTIAYRSLGDFRQPENVNVVLDNIARGMRTGERTFVHCNNGAHASGFIGAIALRSFCGISGGSAVRYWDRTLGGYPLQEPNRSRLMSRIENYDTRSSLELSDSEKDEYGCP